MLRIKKDILDAIIAHSERELPFEACGYLAGRDGIICRHYELTNIDQSTQHFSMAPQEQFAAVKDMRRQGLKLGGVYHSHPATPARPSAEDIRLAHDPNLTYIIVSLAGETPVVRAFSIRGGEAEAEPLEIIEQE